MRTKERQLKMKEPITQNLDYYDLYWKQGLGVWSPAGVTISPFEVKLLEKYAATKSKVLDFGCGGGSHVGGYFMSTGRSYVGVDLSPSAVEACKEKGLKAVLVQSNEELPFEEKEFNIVISFEVLEHLFRPDKAVAQIHRVLKDEGWFIGSVPNIAYFPNRVVLCCGYFSAGGSPATSLKKPWMDPHIRFFTKKSLVSLLSESFRKVTVLGCPFSMVDLPVLYRMPKSIKKVLDTASIPLKGIGQLWPSMFSSRLYFVAQN